MAKSSSYHMGGQTDHLIKTVIEAVLVVVVAGALFPVLTSAIENATGITGAGATLIGLVPFFLSLGIAYKLIMSAVATVK